MLKLTKLLLLISLFSLSCRSITAKKVTKLPKILVESSGLVVISPNSYWSHNDGGGEAKLYQFDKKGHLLKTIPVCDATNRDWEEIQLDADDNFYIGDFGNNAQMRKDLTIYKIPQFSQKLNETCLKAEKIQFSYENQTHFPPADSSKHFDAEAMIPTKDYIYIFTKDFYSQPYSGKTWVFQIPNKAGQHIAKQIAIIETNKKGKNKGAITAAAYDEKSQKLALMGYQKLWILRGGIEEAIFDINRKEYTFGLSQFAQREAISFADSCTLYITSERLKNIIGGNLSKVRICDLPNSPYQNLKKD